MNPRRRQRHNTQREFATMAEAVAAGACPLCLGSGRTFDLYWNLDVHCARCAGTGQLPIVVQ